MLFNLLWTEWFEFIAQSILINISSAIKFYLNIVFVATLVFSKKHQHFILVQYQEQRHKGTKAQSHSDVYEFTLSRGVQVNFLFGSNSALIGFLMYSMFLN